jgi:anti-sigma factor ChrR (cupin superfamily)
MHLTDLRIRQFVIDEVRLSSEEIEHSDNCSSCIHRVRDEILSQMHAANGAPTDRTESKPVQFARMQTVRQVDRKWEETAFPGVEICRLFVDGEGGGALIVKMQPGAIYPMHEHGGREQFYLISGDMRIGVKSFNAGDYHRAESGTVHEVVSTIGGCSCLVVGYIGITS